MKLWVGVTDKDWFSFLASRQVDEVNFWQPSAGTAFRALEPGGLFLFKLHSPLNFIVGGGFFVRHTALPAKLAWEAFAEKNGVADFRELVHRIRKYRKSDEPNPVIGCNVLVEPFFLPESDWIPVPSDWAPNIVRGKTYDSHSDDGAALFAQIQGVLSGKGVVADDSGERYGQPYLAKARLGQGAFRVLVADAYNRRCSITGEKTLPALEAAHIRPYAAQGPHRVSNGLLLRSDLHRLFDAGYLTVTPERRIEVSKRIREEFSNGKEYYAYHGRQLAVVPREQWAQPNIEYLDWHNNNVFERPVHG